MKNSDKFCTFIALYLILCVIITLMLIELALSVDPDFERIVLILLALFVYASTFLLTILGKGYNELMGESNVRHDP